MEYFSRASQAKPVFEKSVEYEGAGCEGCGGFGGERVKRIEYNVPGSMGYVVERYEYAYDSEDRLVSQSTLVDRQDFTYD